MDERSITQDAGFEIRACTLDLLEEREADGAVEKEGLPLVRRAVYVSCPCTRAMDRGLATVTRRVLVGFAYGADVVSYERTTSAGLEVGKPVTDAEKAAARQLEVAEAIGEAVRERVCAIEPKGRLPVFEGVLGRVRASAGGEV